MMLHLPHQSPPPPARRHVLGLLRRFLSAHPSSAPAGVQPHAAARWMDICAKTGRPEDVLNLYDKLVKSGSWQPNALAETARLKALKREGRYAEVLQGVKEWKVNEPRRRATWHMALVSCAGLGDGEQALQFLHEAEKALNIGDDRNGSRYGVTVEMYNITLLTLAKNGQASLALELLGRMEKQPSPGGPNVMSYGIVIDGYARMGDYKQALALLECLEARGLKANEVMYGSILHACSRARRIDQAQAVLDQMEAKGHQVNAVILGTVLEAYGKVGNWQGAQRLFEKHKPQILARYRAQQQQQQQQQQSQPQQQQGMRNIMYNERNSRRSKDRDSLSIMYTNLISALGRGRQWQAALDFLRHQMPKDGVQPDVVSYHALMHACGRARQFKVVWELFQELLERAEEEEKRLTKQPQQQQGQEQQQQLMFRPTVLIFNVVLRSFLWGSEKDWPRAMLLLDDMRKGLYKGVQANMETYRIVLSVLANFKQAEVARNLYNILASESLGSTKLAAEVLLAYANAEDGENALNFFAELRKEGPLPNGLCYSRAMLACGRSGRVEEAQALLEEMRSRGFLGEIYQSLVDGSSLAGVEEEKQKERNWEEAASLSAAITQTFAANPEITPGPMALNTALSVFCSMGNWADGVTLLRQMASFKVEPTEINRAALMSSIAAAGQWPVAVYLLEDFIQLHFRNVGTSGFAGLAQGLPDDVLRHVGPLLYRQLQRQELITHSHPDNAYGGNDGNVSSSKELLVDFHRFGSRQSVCAVLVLLEDMAAAGGRMKEGGKQQQVSLRDLSDLVMVVGRGKNNTTGVGVLGPYLIKALACPTLFDPPMVARPLPNNPGRIILPRDQVAKYIKARRARLGEKGKGRV